MKQKQGDDGATGWGSAVNVKTREGDLEPAFVEFLRKTALEGRTFYNVTLTGSGSSWFNEYSFKLEGGAIAGIVETKVMGSRMAAGDEYDAEGRRLRRELPEPKGFLRGLRERLRR